MTKTPVAVLGIDLGKNSCSLAGLDARRRGGVRVQSCGLRGRHGGLLRSALPRPPGHLEERGAVGPAGAAPARQRLVSARTRLANQLRAVLLERGVILPKRRAPLRQRLDELMGAGQLEMSARALRLLEALRDEWRAWTGGSRSMMTSWRLSPARTIRRAGRPPSPASASSAPPRCWPPSATVQPSPRGETSRHGWG